MAEDHLPVMTVPIRTHEIVLGEITLNPDGTFSGIFHNEDVFFGMRASLNVGFADSIAMYANFKPEKGPNA